MHVGATHVSANFSHGLVHNFYKGVVVHLMEGIVVLPDLTIQSATWHTVTPLGTSG